MDQRSPSSTKLIRGALACLGAAAIASAIVNVIAAWRLFEPGDEEALGLTRGEITGWCCALLGIGVTLLLLALRRRK